MANTYFQFGTRLNPQMIPMFAASPAMGKQAFTSQTTFLNGGTKVRNSVASHMEYGWTWTPAQQRDDLRPLMDYADGLYDTTTGVNLMFFIDPTAADKNVAPIQWSFPALGARDGMPVLSNALGPFRPKGVPTATNTLGYPAMSAQYTLAGTEVAKKLYIPIPPGFTAWVGAAFTVTGATGVQVTPFTGASAGAIVPLTALALTDPSRFNASFSSANYTGLEVQVTVGAGVLTWTGMMIQMLPTGTTPKTGRFISGQGHSGCEFVGKPLQTVYNVVSAWGVENVGMSVKLVETGDWA